MPQNAASPQMRTMTDMTDAQAQDAMKRAIEIDALADAELNEANQMGQQISQAAPGSAPILEAEADVWVVVGDGGFQMTMCELATMVQENLKVNIAIINNGYLGMIRQWQEFFYDRNYEASPILSPNFVKLADAFGIRSVAVTQRSQVVPTVEMAHNHNGPVLIDFQVEQEDSVYPMVAAGAGLHEMIRRPNPLVETSDDE